MGVQFPGKKRYVTLEWPPRCKHCMSENILVSSQMYVHTPTMRIPDNISIFNGKIQHKLTGCKQSMSDNVSPLTKARKYPIT